MTTTLTLTLGNKKRQTHINSESNHFNRASYWYCDSETQAHPHCNVWEPRDALTVETFLASWNQEPVGKLAVREHPSQPGGSGLPSSDRSCLPDCESCHVMSPTFHGQIFTLSGDPQDPFNSHLPSSDPDSLGLLDNSLFPIVNCMKSSPGFLILKQCLTQGNDLNGGPLNPCAKMCSSACVGMCLHARAHMKPANIF